MTSFCSKLSLNLIRALHLLLVLYVILTPFLTKDKALLRTHILVVGSIIFHWKINNNTCFLTLMESKLRGKKSEDTFFGKLVSPVYDISEKEIRYGTYFILFYSIFNLYRIK